MVTPAPLFAAAALRLHHRSFLNADGIRMVSEDGKRAVWLTAKQHSALLDDFVEAMRPINRRTKWGFILSGPVVILTCGIIFSLGLEPIIYNSGVPGVASVADVLLITWWPLFLVAYHWAASRRVNRRIEARLSSLPAAPLPIGRHGGFQTLEIVALFIVGPGLVLDIIGSLFPQALDNTPMTNREVDLGTIAGLAVFAVLAGRRLLNRRPKEAPALEMPMLTDGITQQAMAGLAEFARRAWRKLLNRWPKEASAPEAPMSTDRIARMTARAHTQAGLE